MNRRTEWKAEKENDRGNGSKAWRRKQKRGGREWKTKAKVRKMGGGERDKGGKGSSQGEMGAD